MPSYKSYWLQKMGIGHKESIHIFKLCCNGKWQVHVVFVTFHPCFHVWPTCCNVLTNKLYHVCVLYIYIYIIFLVFFFFSKFGPIRKFNLCLAMSLSISSKGCKDCQLYKKTCSFWFNLQFFIHFCLPRALSDAADLV